MARKKTNENNNVVAVRDKNGKPLVSFTNVPEGSKVAQITVPMTKKTSESRIAKIGLPDRETEEGDVRHFDTNTFPNRISRLSRQLRDVLINKNALYGDSYAKSCDKHGKIIQLIRIEDKLNRLQTLLKPESTATKDIDFSFVEEESINDTLLDIAGYALLAIDYNNRKDDQ